MRLRSEEELNRALSSDIAWRKIELSAHHKEVESAALASPKRKAITRAAIAMLYGHWEGYVKIAAQAYLNYVTFQRQPLETLKDNFYFIALWKECGSRDPGLQNVVEAAKTLPRSVAGKHHTMYDGAINTKGNLNYATLMDILTVCGLNGSIFITKKYFIDSKLLDRRNHIAHGQYIDVESEDIDEYFRETIALMEGVRSTFENAVIQKQHLRA